MRIFLDSGAFSVWNKGKQISLDKYIEFCKYYEQELDAIATLDVIPGKPYQKLPYNETKRQAREAAKQGMSNYKKMLKAGISQEKLVHVFHQGDPEEMLLRLIKMGGPYIGISPANDRTSKQRQQWINTILPYLIDNKGAPKVKFHGFAVTSLELIFAYPWYSVDSSSWRLRGGGYGLIDLPTSPDRLTKKEHYYIQSIPIGKGVKNFGRSEKGLLDLDTSRATQAEASFRKKGKLYKKKVEDILTKYNFNLELLEENAYARAVWNAIYLMTSAKKFSDCIIYLASNDYTSIKLLHSKLNEIEEDIQLNILVSYANMPKNVEGSVFRKLLDMKKEGFNA
jgi:hypothetical protein